MPDSELVLTVWIYQTIVCPLLLPPVRLIETERCISSNKLFRNGFNNFLSFAQCDLRSNKLNGKAMVT
jgi:hypothetical protein